jgi:hypothetical protein
MDRIAPQLTPPVSREPIGSADTSEEADVMSCTFHLTGVNCTTWFADGDA